MRLITSIFFNVENPPKSKPRANIDMRTKKIVQQRLSTQKRILKIQNRKKQKEGSEIMIRASPGV